MKKKKEKPSDPLIEVADRKRKKSKKKEVEAIEPIIEIEDKPKKERKKRKKKVKEKIIKEKERLVSILTIDLPEGYIKTPSSYFDYSDYQFWWETKWYGPAWLCPVGHQLHQTKIDWGFNGGNKYATFCGGCSRWVDFVHLKWDPEIKRRTAGHSIRGMFEDADVVELVDTSDSKSDGLTGREGSNPSFGTKEMDTKDEANGNKEKRKVGRPKNRDESGPRRKGDTKKDIKGSKDAKRQRRKRQKA